MKKEILDLDDGHSLVMYERNTPVDLNIIDSALFIKNNKWCNHRTLKIHNQKIDIVGGTVFKKVEIEKNGKKIIDKVAVELTVPGKFDEDVYLSIIYQFIKTKQKFKLSEIPQAIICTYSDLMKNLKISNSRQDKVRAALDVLRYTTYQIEEVFLTCDSEIINEDDLIKLSNDKKISKVSIKEGINLINYAELKIEEMTVSELKNDTFLNEDEISDIIKNTDSRTKYFLKIKLNDRMYKNLVNKVYMLHSLEYLLEIPAVERGIFNFCYLHNGKSIKQGKYFPLSANNMVILGITDIAERVPLSVDDKKINKTYSRILDGLNYLKSNGYIKEFIGERMKPIRESYFTVEFYIHQNRKSSEYVSHDLRVLKAPDHKEKSVSIQKFEIQTPDGKNIELINPKTNHIIEIKKTFFDSTIEEIESRFNTIVNKNNKNNLYKLFKEFENYDIVYDHYDLNLKKGPLILSAIKNWLFSYKNVKRLNGLLKTCIADELYADAYEDIIFNEVNIIKQREKDLLIEEENKKSILEQTELEEIKKKNRNAKFSEWTSQYHKLSSEQKNSFMSKAVQLKNSKESISNFDDEHLAICCYAYSLEKSNLKYFDSVLKLTGF